MRTDAEIIARIRSRESADWLVTEVTDLLTRLPFDAARPWLKDGVAEADWQQAPRDRDALLKEMLDYMPFAWDKANSERGLSAGRSMSHYSAWIWLAGDDLGDLANYKYYGKDNLVQICQHYGWDHKQWDDGIRTN